MLFQTSDTTWQAYNQYGGNSLYTGSPPAGPTRSATTGRSPPARAAPEDWVFNAEYPMVRWLEPNGYDVSYSSGVDTDRRGAELLEHKVFMSVGHDEYWSGQQRANVEAARAAGVNLAFFSGNEIFWKTRWENSIDASGTPYRTLVTYKETHANAIIDPQAPPTWTGTWRDPRFSPPGDGGRPENALTGHDLQGQLLRDQHAWSAPPTARCGSGATPGSPPSPPTRPPRSATGIIGYEWDEDLDNGFRPPGLIRLSRDRRQRRRCCRTTAAPTAAAAATHPLTLYRAPSGALVFGAGTVQWSWGAGQQPRPRLGAPPTPPPAGDGQPVRRHGRPADDPPGRAGRGDGLHRHRRPRPRRSPRRPTARRVPVGSPVTVTGTATDTGGGRVGGVEVSTDNGATWHRATGRGTWTYTFTPTANGTITIRSRGADDSAQPRDPAAGDHGDGRHRPGDLPVHDLAGHGDARRRRDPTPARSSSA